MNTKYQYDYINIPFEIRYYVSDGKVCICII